eukprot:400875-Pelagomonas_calceolata.AAC.1
MPYFGTCLCKPCGVSLPGCKRSESRAALGLVCIALKTCLLLLPTLATDELPSRAMNAPRASLSQACLHRELALLSLPSVAANEPPSFAISAL